MLEPNLQKGNRTMSKKEKGKQIEDKQLFYLLECEIIGANISSVGKNLVVKPIRVYPKSATLKLENEFGILVKEETQGTFKVANPETFIFVTLDQEGFLTLKIKPRSYACDLLIQNYSSVILELELKKSAPEEKSEKDFTVVGFKVQFYR